MSDEEKVMLVIELPERYLFSITRMLQTMAHFRHMQLTVLGTLRKRIRANDPCWTINLNPNGVYKEQ
jgi:hypothetical protein